LNNNIMAVDVCNTISNINSQLEKYNADHEIYPTKFPEGFWSHGEGLYLFAKAEPMPGAAKAINYLKNLYKCKIIYVTKRPPEARFITLHWLKDYGFPPGRIVFCEDKPSLLIKKIKPLVVLEDDPFTVKQITAKNNRTLVFMQIWPYNQHLKGRNIIPVTDWTKIIPEPAAG